MSTDRWDAPLHGPARDVRPIHPSRQARPEPRAGQGCEAGRRGRVGGVQRLVVVWKLDRLGRSLRHLVNTIGDLTETGIGLKVLTGQGAAIDSTTPAGQLVFAALAEDERSLISERTIAGLNAARARGRTGGRPYTMTPAKIRLAAAAMSQRNTSASQLCAELGISRQTLYRYISPTGQLRPDATTLLAKAKAAR